MGEATLCIQPQLPQMLRTKGDIFLSLLAALFSARFECGCSHHLPQRPWLGRRSCLFKEDCQLDSGLKRKADDMEACCNKFRTVKAQMSFSVYLHSPAPLKLSDEPKRDTKGHKSLKL